MQVWHMLCYYCKLCVLMCILVFKILRLGLDQIEAQNDLRDLPHKALNLNYSSNDVQWNPKDGTVPTGHHIPSPAHTAPPLLWSLL